MNDRIYVYKMPYAWYPWVVEATAACHRRLVRPQRFRSWSEAMRWANKLAGITS